MTQARTVSESASNDVDLWTLTAAGDDLARQQILDAHLGLVHFVARQIARGIGGEFEFDELVSAGTLGLLGAVDSFEPARGLAFSTFATPRIRGAILDEFRRQDHASRSVRKRARDLRAAADALGRGTGATPSDSDTATYLGVDVETLWRWQADVASSVQVSLDAPLSGDSEDGASTAEVLCGSAEAGIEDELTLSQETEYLRDAILALKKQERTVLSLYYYEDMKLREIATVLGITESRVSQIRTQAIANLHTALAHLRAEVA